MSEVDPAREIAMKLAIQMQETAEPDRVTDAVISDAHKILAFLVPSDAERIARDAVRDEDDALKDGPQIKLHGDLQAPIDYTPGTPDE